MSQTNFEEQIKAVVSGQHENLKENGNINGESAGGKMFRFGDIAGDYLFRAEVPSTFVNAHVDGDIHIHDRSYYFLSHNCIQVDAKKLFANGFSTGHGFIRPPQRIESYGALIAIILQSVQGDCFGGVSIPDFDFVMAGGVRKTFRQEFGLELGRLPLVSDIQELRNKTWDMAWRNTERRTYQTMEALIFNLCTLQSRAGGQVPFSNLNYGLDTSAEGRMATRCLLKATMAGLGKGEVPIFPVQIFKTKEGVNYNEGDPNYDLFQLAMECSAKRMWPNFAFLDANFNKNQDVAYMGCVDGQSVITYKLDDVLYCESIERLYSRLEVKNKPRKRGLSYYFIPESLSVWDSRIRTFVAVKKVIKNTQVVDWARVKYQGRILDCTSDHPLPIKGLGRTFVKDIPPESYAPVTYIAPTTDEFVLDEDLAWAYGLFLCDASLRGQVIISLGADETDLVKKVQEVFPDVFSFYSDKKHNNYQVLIRKSTSLAHELTALFGGINKVDRHIPNEIFRAPYSVRMSFLAGMVDGDGYINDRPKGLRVQIGSVNRELAIQQMLLANSLGFPAKIYGNAYSRVRPEKIRWRVEFGAERKLLDILVSKKKREKQGKSQRVAAMEETKITVTPLHRVADSYDLETETDFFDVDGIISHNCRTRVVANVFDSTKKVAAGRGNLFFTTINLPRLAIQATGGGGTLGHGDILLFFNLLDNVMDLGIRQLHHRFDVLAHKKVRNFPFLFGEGIWLGSETLDPDDKIGDVWKHGTLSLGFLGLAETLIALLGKHHGESGEAQELGLEIVGHMRKRLDFESRHKRMNFTLLATPAEGLAGRFVKLDQTRYGTLPGVTDKEYYTNSFHVPVDFTISAFDKIAIEAPYHALTNAGHITYVELDGDPSKNLGAFESIVRAMHDAGIGYGAINHPLDFDPVCGFSGVIDNECPGCGRKADEKVQRTRRITGYLAPVNRWNAGKLAELKDRRPHACGRQAKKKNTALG